MRVFRWLILLCLWMLGSQPALAFYGFEEKIQPIAVVTLDSGEKVQVGYLYSQSHILQIPVFQDPGRFVAYVDDEHYSELPQEQLDLLAHKRDGSLKPPWWLKNRLLNAWVPAFLLTGLTAAWVRRKKILSGTIQAGSSDWSNILQPERYVNSPAHLTTMPCPAFTVRRWGMTAIALGFWLTCLGLLWKGGAEIHGVAWVGVSLFAFLLVRTVFSSASYRFDEKSVHFSGSVLGLAESWSEPYENYEGLSIDATVAGQTTIYRLMWRHPDPSKTLVMLQKSRSQAGMAEEQARLQSLLPIDSD